MRKMLIPLESIMENKITDGVVGNNVYFSALVTEILKTFFIFGGRFLLIPLKQ